MSTFETVKAHLKIILGYLDLNNQTDREWFNMYMGTLNSKLTRNKELNTFFANIIALFDMGYISCGNHFNLYVDYDKDELCIVGGIYTKRRKQFIDSSDCIASATKIIVENGFRVSKPLKFDKSNKPKVNIDMTCLNLFQNVLSSKTRWMNIADLCNTVDLFNKTYGTSFSKEDIMLSQFSHKVSKAIEDKIIQDEVVANAKEEYKDDKLYGFE